MGPLVSLFVLIIRNHGYSRYKKGVLGLMSDMCALKGLMLLIRGFVFVASRANFSSSRKNKFFEKRDAGVGGDDPRCEY